MINRLLFRVFPFIAICLYAMDFILHGTIFIIAGFLLVLPYLCRYANILLRSKTITKFIFMVLIGSVFNLFTTQNGIGGTVNFIACVGMALYCVNHSRLTGLLVAGACFILLYYVSNAMFVDGVGANYVFESKGLSRNYPGFMAVIYICYWGFTKYHNYNSYPLLLPILALVLCFFLEGRASLGVMLMICGVSFFYFCKNYISLFLIALIAILWHYWGNIVELFYLSRFADSGLESARSIIWKTYFQSLNIPYLLFGLDTLSVPVLNEFGGNPHNSFLNYHYRMGILGVVALFMLIVKSFKILLSKKQFVSILYIALLLVRCFFDSCIGGPSDFMLYAMLFYPIVKNRSDDNSENHQNQSFISQVINKIILII